MPASYSWTLLVPPTATPADAADVSTAGAPLLPCPIVQLTQQDFLDLFDRLLPGHYLEPLKAPGPGYEALQAFAKLGERLSLAVERLGCDSFISSATGGGYAVGTVELFRSAPVAEIGLTVTVKAGTLVMSSKGGRAFATTEDVVFAPSDLGPFTVPVISIAKGYEWNERGEVIAADGTPLAGEIDTIDVLVEDPDFGDITIQVRQLVSTSGGADASLDQHGADRGITRLAGEVDAAYRGRVRALPDNISPDAVERALLQLSASYPLSFDVIETWEITYQTCFDAPSTTIPGSNFDPNLCCYDDPRSPLPFRNRWLDEVDYRGAFIVVLSNLPAIDDVGFAFDDTATGYTDLTTAAGTRAIGAYDVPNTFTLAKGGGYDGFDLPKQAVYKGIWDTLQNIKAAGIAAEVELEGE